MTTNIVSLLTVIAVFSVVGLIARYVRSKLVKPLPEEWPEKGWG